MTGLQKGSDSQLLQTHLPTKEPPIWLLQSSSMALEFLCILSGKSGKACIVLSLTCAMKLQHFC